MYKTTTTKKKMHLLSQRLRSFFSKAFYCNVTLQKETLLSRHAWISGSGKLRRLHIV